MRVKDISQLKEGTRVRLMQTLGEGGINPRLEGFEGTVESLEYRPSTDSHIAWIKWDNLNLTDPFAEPENPEDPNSLEKLKIIGD